MKFSALFPWFSPDDGGYNRPYLDALLQRDWTGALPLLKEAAAKEDCDAMGFLGAMYAMGLGVEKDNAESTLWLRQAAIRGHCSSQSALGMCYAYGLGVPRDCNEASYWLFKAAKSGHALSINALAALASKDPEIVGPHFSEDELIELVQQLPHLVAEAMEKAKGK